MKQIYHFTGTAGKQQSLKAGVALLLMGVMLTLLPAALQAQEIKPFTQRTSNYSPDMPIYHIKGDYTMIGNTNLSNIANLSSDNDTEENNSSTTMFYVDVDGNTFPTINSSTAALTFSEEFGANPVCSEVLYAGLYWTGITDDQGMDRTITEAEYSTTPHTLNSENNVIGGYTLNITQSGNDRIFTFTNGSETVVLRMTMVAVLHESYWGDYYDWIGYNYYVHNISNGAENQIYNHIPESFWDDDNSSEHTASDLNVPLPGTNYIISQLYWNSTLSECSATVREIVTPAYIISKNKIKIRHDNAPGYTEVEAALQDIYYNYQSTTTVSNRNKDVYIYTAYTEVTDYVRQYGLGNYTVADLLTEDGNGGTLGYFGCWGMVVVYENSKMKWRDITLFDGFANVSQDNPQQDISISGFKTVQVGDVHVKLGMMAAEGDRGITGDGCAIAKHAGGYQTLGHPNLTSNDDNFFNSSIETGRNYRYPNYVNNTGIDILMIELQDPEIFTNEQTEASFRFTTLSRDVEADGHDQYHPFLFVMGVDAYIPEAEALSGVMNIDEDDVTIDSETGNYLIEPGKEITFAVEVKNFGTEDIVDAKLEIPLPSTIVYYRTEVEYVHPGINIEGYFDAERYANGVAGWNIDYIPSGDPNQVYARVLLTVKVTDDCYVLASTDEDCELAIEVNGTLEGTSYVNRVYFKKESFISGFADETGCQGNAIRNDIKVVVNKENYVNNNCQDQDYTERVVTVCENEFRDSPIPFMKIYALYPQGSRFFNAATSEEYTEATGFPISLAGNNASSAALIHVQPTSIYSAACTSDLRFILDPDGDSFSDPTFTESATYCLDAEEVNPLLSHITSEIPNDVYFRFYKENSNSAVAYVDIVPPTDVEGTYTYYVRQFRKNAIGCEDETFYGPITIEVVSPITFTSTEDSPSCVGRPVTITGIPEGGTWSWEDPALNERITISGNDLTIDGNFAGTYTVTYTHNNPDSAGYSCTNTARSYTHQIAATTNPGTLEADQIICQGAQIQPLQIVEHNGHVERWEWTTNQSNENWDPIPNNTSSISTADLGELAVGTYYFKALVKDGNCNAEWTDIVTIEVTDDLAPDPPAVTSPQFACIGTVHTIQPSGDNYQWYEQAIGGWPIEDANGVTVTVTDEYITRYVSVVDAETHCVSDRALVVVRPNLEPGEINSVGQRECDLDEMANTIGSDQDAVVYGGGAVEYQWYVKENGGEEQLINGATSATFIPQAYIYMGEEGEYIFIRKVKNSTCANWQQSRGEWRLVVGKPDASIEAVPGHATICRNGGIELRLRVPASTAYSYQWYKDGIAIPNETGHEYIATVAGRYTAQVTHRASDCSAITPEASAIEVKYDDAAPTATSVTTELNGCSIADVQAVTKYSNVIDANASEFDFNISDEITPENLLTLACEDETVNSPTGVCYQLVRTYTVTDQCGNSTTFTHTINVVDSVAPVITCSDNLTLNTDDGQPYATVRLQDPTPVDNCSATYRISYSPATPTNETATNETATNASGQYPLGVTTVTYSVVDGCGNANSCSFTVTVTDDENPVITCPELSADNYSATTDEGVDTYTHQGTGWDATATDNDDISSLTYELSGVTTGSGSSLENQVFNMGVTTVTWTVVDNSNLSATCSYTVTVTDDENPVITCPSNIAGIACITDVPAAYADYAAFQTAGGEATDNDEVDYASFALFSADTNGFCPTTITRTYYIEDITGNSATCEQVITIKDSIAPALKVADSWPDNITGQDNCFANRNISGLMSNDTVKALYSDCNTFTVSNKDTVTGNNCGWTVTRTYTITDLCGNTVMPKPTMSVSGRDQTAPVIESTVLDSTLTATNCVFRIPDMRDEVRNISTDCSEITVTQPSAGMVVYPMVAERDTTVNVIVTDICGNSSEKEVIITIPAKVTISAMATPAVICNGGTSQLSAIATNVVGTAVYAWAPATGLSSATIANPTVTLTATSAPDTVTYTVQVTDANGCTAAATASVTVNPEVVITALADTVINSGTAVPAKFFTTPLTGGVMTYSWTRTNSDVVTGMDATGTGNVPGATLYNNTNTAKTTTITVTPTFTANGISCVGATVSYTITVNPTIVMDTVANQAICHGSEIEPVTFGTTITDATSFVYNWVRTNSDVVTGMDTTGIGNIDATALYNETDQVQVTTFTVTPTYTNNGISSTGTPITFDVTVYPEVVMNTVAAQTICHNTAITPITFGTSITDGTMSYAWTRTNTENITPWAGSGNGNIGAEVLSNTTGTYQITEVSVTPTYTNNGKSCVGAVQNFTITVNPEVVMNTPDNIFVCHNESIEDINFSSNLTGGTMSYAWTSSNSSVGGVASSGTDNIPSTVLTNTTTTAQTTTITVTPTYTANGISCEGAPITFTITVNPKVVMNDVADQAICHGGEMAAVNFTTPITDGSVLYNWTRTNDNIGGLASSGTGNIAATVLTNTTTTAQTTTITVTPVYTNNGNECTDETITFTVTVNPEIGMDTPDNQAICHGSAIAAVNFTTPITDGSVVYNWSRNNENIEGLEMSGTGNIAAATLTNTTNTAQTTTITVTPVYANNGKTCTDETITFTITVYPKVVMDTVADQAICHGSAITAVNFSSDLSGGDITYTWRRTNSNIGGLDMSGTDNIPSTVLTNTTTTAQTTTITVTPTYTANGISCEGAPITFTITVNPKVVMNDVADQAICHGGEMAAVNFTTPITDGSVLYNWTRTNDNIGGLASSGTGNIAATVLTNTTNTAQVDTIYVKPTYEANNNVCDDDSVFFTITVNPKVVMNDVADQAICHGSEMAAVNFTTPITDGSVVYNWSRDNNNIGGLAMSGTGNIAAATLTNTTNTVQVDTITVTPVYTNNGKTCTDETITFTITVNPKVVMDTVADQAICHGSEMAAVNFTTPITDGSVVYNWSRDNNNIGGLAMSGTGNIPATVLTNTTNTVQVDTITVTPVYTNNGNECTDETITFTITVNPKVVMNDVADQAICHNSAIEAVNFTTTITDGSVVYNWSRDNDNISGLDMSGTGNIAAATLTNTTNTAQTTTITVTPVYTNNGNECTDESITFTITVNPEVVMNTVEDWTLCVGETSPEYVYTSTITDGTVTYGWSNDNSAIGLAAAGSGNLPSFVAANSTSADLIAEVKVAPTYTNNGISCQGDSINFHITVRPSITTPGNVAFTCPADTTVVLSYSECEQFVNIGYPEFVNNMTGMDVDITNDAPEGNIFPEGTTIVTWTATDECGAFLTCTQNVVVQFPSCGDSIADFDGYRYSSVRIGCQCWTGENARSEHYSDGTPVDNFRYYNDSDSLENIYGKLYTWYTAVRVPEGDDTAVPADSIDPLGNSYVQGICPEGWALPTVDEYMLMIANSGNATHAKDGSNLHWLPGYEGQPPFSGFDAYGAGKYNGAIDRYQELLGKTYFWTTLSGSGSETATTVEINYYCAEGLQTELSKGDGVSIRCIRKR